MIDSFYGISGEYGTITIAITHNNNIELYGNSPFEIKGVIEKLCFPNDKDIIWSGSGNLEEHRKADYKINCNVTETTIDVAVRHKNPKGEYDLKTCSIPTISIE